MVLVLLLVLVLQGVPPRVEGALVQPSHLSMSHRVAAEPRQGPHQRPLPN